MSEHIRPSAESLLAAALDYHSRGWSIIPMAMGAKRPARRWKRYQRRRATEAQILKWFGDGSGYGIGVIFGGVSGGLASREWDVLDGYVEWAADYPDLARILPTVQSRRGRHVYCIASAGSVEAIRAALGKPGTGAISQGDGELRAGPGCYSVLPPSVHPSGHVYDWAVPLGDNLPVVDLKEAGFLTCQKGVAEYTYSLSESPNTQASNTDTNTDSSHEIVLCRIETVEAAIEASLPRRAGERHDRIFDFARRLKAIPELAGATAAELIPHVRRWHARALPIIGTKGWDETLFDFLAACAGAKHPAGREPLKAMLARADAAGPPDVALAFDQPALRRLIGLCRELQRVAGDQPFALACRPPAELFEVDHDTVSVWLKRLCHAGILRRERAGDFTQHRAAEYRYLPPL